MTRRLRLLGSLATVGYLAGCGVSGGATGDALTHNEVSELVGVLLGPPFSEVAGPDPILPPDIDPPIMPAAAAALPIQGTILCDAGGSLGFSGDVTETDDGTSFDVTKTINGCMTVVDGVTFTLVGDPNITSKGSRNDSSGSTDIDGGFSYTASDGRQGGCGIDITLGFSVTSFNLNPSGSVCGIPASDLTHETGILEAVEVR